jgi:hypothetical protein
MVGATGGKSVYEVDNAARSDVDIGKDAEQLGDGTTIDVVAMEAAARDPNRRRSMRRLCVLSRA